MQCIICFLFKCCIISLTPQKLNKPLVMKKKSKNIENANKTHTKSKHHIKSISNDPKKKEIEFFLNMLKMDKNRN